MLKLGAKSNVVMIKITTILMIMMMLLISDGGVHPVHLHGHKFEVVKMGYATYDENGQYKAPNTDICCPCPDDPSVCCTVIDDR